MLFVIYQMKARFDTLLVGGEQLTSVERAILRRVMKFREARKPGKTERELAGWFLTGACSKITLDYETVWKLPREQRRQAVMDFLEGQEKEMIKRGSSEDLYKALSTRYVIERMKYCIKRKIPLTPDKEQP